MEILALVLLVVIMLAALLTSDRSQQNSQGAVPVIVVPVPQRSQSDNTGCLEYLVIMMIGMAVMGLLIR